MARRPSRLAEEQRRTTMASEGRERAFQAIGGLLRGRQQTQQDAQARKALIDAGADPGIVAALPPGEAAKQFNEFRIAQLRAGGQDPALGVGKALFGFGTIPGTGQPAPEGTTVEFQGQQLTPEQLRSAGLSLVLRAIQGGGGQVGLGPQPIQPGGGPPGAMPPLPPGAEDITGAGGIGPGGAPEGAAAPGLPPPPPRTGLTLSDIVRGIRKIDLPGSFEEAGERLRKVREETRQRAGAKKSAAQRRREESEELGILQPTGE